MLRMISHLRVSYSSNNYLSLILLNLDEDIKNWIRNIEQHANENINKVLVGNKCDLVDKRVSINRKVTVK